MTRYSDLLVDLLLVRRLQPYHVNVGKRLVKSPKVFVRDSGLVHALLGIGTLEGLAGHPVAGMSWEGFVAETLLSVLPWRAEAFFYRTATGAKIDLLVRHASGALWAIEVNLPFDPTLLWAGEESAPISTITYQLAPEPEEDPALEAEFEEIYEVIFGPWTEAQQKAIIEEIDEAMTLEREFAQAA